MLNLEMDELQKKYDKLKKAYDKLNEEVKIEREEFFTISQLQKEQEKLLKKAQVENLRIESNCNNQKMEINKQHMRIKDLA